MFNERVPLGPYGAVRGRTGPAAYTPCRRWSPSAVRSAARCSLPPDAEGPSQTPRSPRATSSALQANQRHRRHTRHSQRSLRQPLPGSSFGCSALYSFQLIYIFWDMRSSSVNILVCNTGAYYLLCTSSELGPVNIKCSDRWQWAAGKLVNQLA